MMKDILAGWLPWALLSAGFAALTAILGKAGLTSVNPDLATAIRTAVILCVAMAIAILNGAWQSPATIPSRTWLFLILSGLATGASWLCYFRALSLGDAARVAPVDKLSVVLVALFATLFLGEKLSAHGWLGVVMIFAGVLLTIV